MIQLFYNLSVSMAFYNRQSLAATIDFPAITQFKIADRLQDTGVFWLGFGIWWYDQSVLKDLVAGDSEKYVRSYQNMVKSSDANWRQVYFRGDYKGEEVKAFFKDFHQSFRWLIKPKDLLEFRIIQYESEGPQFKVLPPAYLLN